MLTSADLRHEDIGTVQIESVSVLVFVVTKQKQNEVFFLYKKKRRKKAKFLAGLDGQPLGVSETEPAAESCHPQKQKAWQGTVLRHSGSSLESGSADETPEQPPMGGFACQAPEHVECALDSMCACVCAGLEPLLHIVCLKMSRIY